MTDAELFRAWRTRHSLTQAQAADQLGLSVDTVKNVERGTRREDGRPVRLTRTQRLAMAAVGKGLEPES